MTPDYYYLESDGQVFLLRDRDTWRFPRSKAELPCRFKPGFPMPIQNKIVLFAHPILRSHPAHWVHKDTLAGRPDVDPIVEQAVNRSLPRAAAKVAIVEGGKVLMVKGARGLTQGMWNLPGGFVGYGEHPADSARREVQEELGIRVRLKRLVGVYSEVFPRTGGYMISFIYLGKRSSAKIRPHAEEIAEFQWMPLRQAIRLTHNPFVRSGLKDYLKKPHPRPRS